MMHQHQHSKHDSSGDESDFFELEDLNDETYHSPGGGMAVDLSGMYPVGGMRRVSSCYFSICSNVSNEEGGNFGGDDGECFANVDPLDDGTKSFRSNISETNNNLSSSDYLYHDILMQVFTYLNAHSLASFSETCKKCNFETFYFLELQLQRGLLRGLMHRNEGQIGSGGGDVEKNRGGFAVCGEDELSFIAGTGAISRLAAMDETKAREIVQTYLDSNSSIHAMPLSHSLAYLRQVLLQKGLQMKMRAPVKNVALLFTVLGAASYMHAEMPDPSEVINSENVAALRDALLKMGLAGGVLKKMKEVVEKKSVCCAGDESENAEVLESRPRQSSLGSLEDLSQMLPTAIASRLYSAFSAAPKSVPLNQHQEEANDMGQENTSAKKLHRSKRSHSTTRVPDASCEDKGCDSKPRSVSSPLLVDPNDVQSTESTQQQQHDGNYSLTTDVIAHAINHPLSSNPYDHIPASFCNDKHQPTPSLFSFNSIPTNASTIDNPPALNSAEVPSGCVGAYANAVKSAASHVTRLIKQQRKANFEALSPEEQTHLGVLFIDACSSDDKLSIVKDILQKQNCMDVDRFFLGPDDTETCGLHAAAFHGAEQVLKFLSGGMNEYHAELDCGMCDVDVRDANGWTALHFAAGANSVSSVRILAEHGAKMTIEASNGYTPYHWAERLSNEEVAQELQRLGADNRFVGGWVFGSSTAKLGHLDPTIRFVSFVANRFFGSVEDEE